MAERYLNGSVTTRDNTDHKQKLRISGYRQESAQTLFGICNLEPR